MSKGSIAVIEFRQRVKISLVKAFGDHCALCGVSFPIYVYDFHHIHPSDKKFGIAAGGQTHSKEETFEESKKCVMLCSNCHRIVHSENIVNFPFYQLPNKDIYLNSFQELIEEKKNKQKELFGKKINYGKNHGVLPARDEFKKIIRQKSFKEIALSYNVTDAAVRKRCKYYNLPHTKKDINSYSDEEWNNI